MNAKQLGRVDDQWQYGQGEQGERPAHGDHDGDDVGEREDVLKDGEDAGGEHLVQGIDVGGDAGDEATDRIAIEKGDVHPLEMAEDLRPEIEHDLLAGPLHEVGLDELEQKGENEGAEVESGDLRDARDGNGRQMARKPGVPSGRGSKVGVNGDLDQKGAEDVGA